MKSANKPGQDRGVDSQQLQQLYEKYEEVMLRVAERYFSDDPHAIEDTVQNAWIKIIQNYSRLRTIPAERVVYWMICIVKNEAVSLLRKNRKTVFLEDCGISDTEESFVHSDSLSITEVIEAMPPIYRSVLEMKYVIGLDNHEIAEAMHISLTAVTTRAMRGRYLLKKKLTEAGYDL